jgi:hypothetical protein
MDKRKLRKDRQYHGQRETDKRPCYCLSFVSFPLAMIFSVFFQVSFVHDIVCLLTVFLWPSKGNWQKIDDIRAKGKLTKDRQ